jgi:hypothetical protein
MLLSSAVEWTGVCLPMLIFASAFVVECSILMGIYMHYYLGHKYMRKHFLISAAAEVARSLQIELIKLR